ncbi:MAG TPA: photoactive yellow protein [Roseococcus sp.]|jgi:photoactive yellow protein|nr:photoactive yellow protein [Roseococcus sp.]
MEQRAAIIAFGTTDIDNALARMSATEIDKLAFGAVELDRTGRIIRYNAREGQITGRDPKSVIGRNFFTEVAPCTNTPTFKGKFDEGVTTGNLNALFEYVFNYNMAPTKVKVHMKKAAAGDTFWVFVKRL